MKWLHNRKTMIFFISICTSISSPRKQSINEWFIMDNLLLFECYPLVVQISPCLLIWLQLKASSLLSMVLFWDGKTRRKPSLFIFNRIFLGAKQTRAWVQWLPAYNPASLKSRTPQALAWGRNVNLVTGFSLSCLEFRRVNSGGLSLGLFTDGDSRSSIQVGSAVFNLF